MSTGNEASRLIFPRVGALGFKASSAANASSGLELSPDAVPPEGMLVGMLPDADPFVETPLGILVGIEPVGRPEGMEVPVGNGNPVGIEPSGEFVGRPLGIGAPEGKAGKPLGMTPPLARMWGSKPA
jgi:hypothetical protein